MGEATEAILLHFEALWFRPAPPAPPPVRTLRDTVDDDALERVAAMVRETLQALEYAIEHVPVREREMA